MGRPRKNAAAAPAAGLEPEAIAAAAAEFDFGAPFQVFKDINVFSEFIKRYPDRNGIVAYLYRLEPVINRKQSDPDNGSTLEKLDCDSISYESISRTWGSGKYQIMFNDLNRGKSNNVARCTFSIVESDLPAVLDPAELVVDKPSNAALVASYQQKGYVIVEENGVRKLVPASVAAGRGETAILAEALVKANETNKANALPAGAMVLPASAVERLFNGNDDINKLNQLVTLAGNLNKSPDSELTKLLVKSVLERNNAPAAAPGDGISQMREMFGAMREIREEFGLDNAPARSNPDNGGGWLSFFMQLPAMLANGAQMLGHIRSMQAAGVPVSVPGFGAPGAAALSPGFGQMMPPAGLPNPSEPTQYAGAPAAGSSSSAPAPPSNFQAMKRLGALLMKLPEDLPIEQLKALGTDAAASFRAGETGDEFAARLCAVPNLQAFYERVRDLLETDDVLAAVSVYGPEDVKARWPEFVDFVEDFLLGPDDGDGEPAGDGGTAAAGE